MVGISGSKLRRRRGQKMRRPIGNGDAARGPSNTISLFSAAGDQAFFVYQSALIGVKLAHFSGRSSSAKIAVTGQTGTQAPQSMHSTGLISHYSSSSNLLYSFRVC